MQTDGPTPLGGAFADILNLSRIGALLSRPFFKNYARQYAITLNEWRIIVVTHYQPGLAGQDVARIAGLHPMNVSRAVASLKNARRLVTERDPTNRRKLLLRLTPDGEAVFSDILPGAQERAERMFAVLDAAERRELSRMLARLLERAEELIEEDESEGAELLAVDHHVDE